MTDIFQFGNIYSPRLKLNEMLDRGARKDSLAECQEFISVNRSGASPPLSAIFSLYCSLKHGNTVKEWIKEFESSSLLSNIDVRRFIIYGILKGYIYRVHRYPICSLTLASDQPVDCPKRLLSTLRLWFDGVHCFDEICTRFDLAPRDLEQIIKAMPDCEILLM
jgi:hypothetical protein